jgi:hypothetical protein
MNTFCTCTAEEISVKGFSIRQDIAYCNNCWKPEESTSFSAGPSPRSSDEVSGNAITDLFDFNLEKFVSVTYARFLYTILVTLWTLLLIIAFVVFLRSISVVPGWVSVLFFLGSPTVYLLGLIYTRMTIELIVNFFQIGKDIRAMSQRD